MPIALPESLRKVLIDKAYGHVITFNADGSPQVTMVWIVLQPCKATHGLRPSGAVRQGSLASAPGGCNE